MSSDISVLLKLMNSNVEIELYSSLSMCSYYSQSWLYVPLRRSKPSKQLTSAVGEAKNKTEPFKTCYSGVVVHKCLNWKKFFFYNLRLFHTFQKRPEMRSHAIKIKGSFSSAHMYDYFYNRGLCIKAWVKKREQESNWTLGAIDFNERAKEPISMAFISSSGGYGLNYSLTRYKIDCNWNLCLRMNK